MLLPADDGIVVIEMGPDDHADELTLLANLREHRASLSALLLRQSDHWGFEDPVYRFYHQSWKVFALQSQTEVIVSMLGQLGIDAVA